MSPATPDSLYLCLDQGGHASRALVFDGNGRVVTKSVRNVATQYPQTGWVEHNPEALVKSIKAAIADVVDRMGPAAERLHRAGLATQRSSLVCWDRLTGEPLSPVISWQDRRAREWLEQFSAHTSEVHRRTGLRLSAHYGASKMRWCLEHLPAVAAARRDKRLALGPLASFLLFRLLEEKPIFADPANAARTLLWNLQTSDWDPWLLELFGVPAETLPTCVSTRHAFGTLRANDYKIPLAIATGDQSAALYALGNPTPESLYINLGTGAFIQRAFPQAPDAPGLLSGVVYRDAQQALYVLEGTVNGAGAALKWAEQEWQLDNLEAHLPEWLARDGDVPVFLNGVAGLGAPFWVADFPSRLIGDGAPWQKIVAVAESLVFLLKINVEAMQHVPPASTHILVTGGLAKLDGLCQRLADLCGLPVSRPAVLEATAIGMAYLLAGFPEYWTSMQSENSFTPKPNPGLQQRYENWRTEMYLVLSKH